MSFTKLGVVVPLGAGGDFDSFFLFTSNPILLNGYTYLYYGGGTDGHTHIGLAAAKDGVHFTKLGVVLHREHTSGTIEHIVRGASVLKRNGALWVYYAGMKANLYRTGLAIAEDGVHFTRLGVVLPLGNMGDFDDYHADVPNATERDGAVWAYYTAYSLGGLCVGLAIAEDGVHFTKLGVVLPKGNPGEFDSHYALYPSVVVRGGSVWLYYVGYNGSEFRVGLAIAEDGVHFTKLGVVLPLGSYGDFDDVQTTAPSVAEHDGRMWMYYAGYDGSKYRIGLAISEDGL